MTRVEEFDFMIVNKKFDSSVVKNQKLLEIKISEEANRIFPNRKDKDRTLAAIKNDVRVGKVLEFFFVEFSGGLFRFSKDVYHDLVMPTYDNKLVEVKAYSNPEREWEGLIEKLKRNKKEKWFKASVFYLFGYDNGKYQFYRKTDL